MTKLLVTAILGLAAVTAEEQCGGGAPIKNLLYGCDKEYDTANHICCHNHRGAEYFGFLEAPHIALFTKLNRNERTVFYDSVCGKPLFVAPIGRSFEEFERESKAHGWPSFRPEETVNENVNVHTGGRMSSVCDTHLGHNLPDVHGARYCIDLVCISGIQVGPIPELIENSTSGAVGGFDPYNFTSKKDNAGLGWPKWKVFVVTSLIVVTLAVVAKGVHYYVQRNRSKEVQEAMADMKREATLEHITAVDQ